MIITIKSIVADVVDASHHTEQHYYIPNWQVQYNIIFPEADLTLGYHSIHGVIGWKGDPSDIDAIMYYIKSFYNDYTTPTK